MAALVDRVISLGDEDLKWSFQSELPFFRTRPRGKDSGSMIHVDPCAAYAHPLDLVLEQAEKAETIFPVGLAPNWYLINKEPKERTNGWATTDSFWDAEGKYGREPYIVLSGKRIPLHPAMTRYLVAHEYGHVVDSWISQQESDDPSAYNVLDEEYAKLRGMEVTTDYGPGSWHLHVGEVIANDFRIIVCKTEREFWPHPTVPRPENFPKLTRWWRDKWRKHAVQ